MPPQDLNELEAMRLQVAQTLLEHQIVAQALRAQCLVSAGFVLVLGLLCIFQWRHGVLRESRSLELTKCFYAEQTERAERHSKELIELQRQNGLELDSITRTQWREFAELVWAKQGSSPR